ncbi:hypothetical protein [Streptococcus sp. DD10]|uniref:hypothetical protein n=1 Tax=Streptococcus sp. DD10 TaxID=1777878 RepID=UPI000B2F1636|nr:hypothetical protein [Streptococcus sp. DD10]
MRKITKCLALALWIVTAIRAVINRRYTGNISIQWGTYTYPSVVIDHSGLCG